MSKLSYRNYRDVIMKNLISNPKFHWAIITVAIMTGISTTYISHGFSGQSSSYYKLSNGLNICFQRVTQTFTSLMISSFSSDYLTKDFKRTTSDCFEEVNRVLNKVGKDNSGLLSTLNNLKSDYHWFGQKVSKVQMLAQNGEIDILQSNVSNKYSELEQLKTTLEESLTAKADEANKSRNLAMIGTLLAMILLGLGVFTIIFSRRFQNKAFETLAVVADGLDPDFNELTTEQYEEFSQQLFDTIDHPSVANVIKTYIEELKEKSNQLEDSLLKMNTVEDKVYEIPIEDIEQVTQDLNAVSFDLSLSTALERVQEDVFNHGVILNTEIDDQFSVNSSKEILDQLLCNLLSFAVRSSAKIEGSRKISLKSKALGGIAYCKMRINGHAFSEDELGVLAGRDSGTTTDVNLLLLKELTADAGATIAVKNIQNSQTGIVESEIELVFDRTREQQPTTDDRVQRTVVKGNKAQIKEHFARQLQM